MLLATAMFLLLPLPVLVVTHRNGQPALVFPLLWNRTFSLAYVHSVHKTPVEENFTVQPGGRMVLTSTSFDTLGVGIPFSPREGVLVNRENRFILTGINREFEAINLKAIPLARQSITFDGKRYAFNDYFARGATIRLKADRYPAVHILWRKIMPRKEQSLG